MNLYYYNLFAILIIQKMEEVEEKPKENIKSKFSKMGSEG